MPSQTSNFINSFLGLFGPFRPLVEPFTAPIIGIEYLAHVQYPGDPALVDLQQSPGAGSSTDPMPSSVLGSRVHRYLTLTDIARLRQVSQTAQQDINQHGGASYVQSLLHTDIAQLSPVILNELILMGQPIDLPNGAFLNRLSDAAFQRYVSQQTNLHSNDIIGLDPSHIALLTEQQLLRSLINSRLDAAHGGLYSIHDLYLAMTRSGDGPAIRVEVAAILPMMEIYYSAHPENSHNFSYLVAQLWQMGYLEIGEDPADEALFQRLMQYDALDRAGRVDSEPSSPGGGSDGSLRRLKVISEDAVDSTYTVAKIGIDEFLKTKLETAHDHDWISVNLFKGNTYTFRMTKIGGSLDTYLTLRDARGKEVTHNDDADGTLNSRITFTADNSGTYFLDASSYASLSSGSYAIRTSLNELGVNSQHTSALTADKKNQLYKLELKAGQRYEFQMNKEPTGPYFDAYLYLRDTNKNEITHDDDSGLAFFRDSKIMYTATSDGVYYLDATSYQQKFVGKYTVASHLVI